MITAIVNFKLPEGTTTQDAAKIFRESAPRYRGVPGLVRKYHVFGDDGTGGGIYLWRSREAAEALYDAAWRQMIRERYGAEPSVRYFETPVIVDNVIGEIQTEITETK
jgi:hypothetical protein